MTKRQLNDELVKELEAQMKALEDERTKLFKKKKPIDDKLVKTYEELNKLVEQRDKLLVDGIDSQHPDWDFLLESNSHGSVIKSAARDRLLAPMGLRSSGYFEATQQVAIEIQLDYMQNIEKTLQGLRALRPHIKPVNNILRFGVFEHTLSAFGVYELYVAKEGEKCRLVKTTHGRQSDVSKFDNLRDALKYIAKHCWYQGKPAESEY